MLPDGRIGIVRKGNRAAYLFKCFFRLAGPEKRPGQRIDYIGLVWRKFVGLLQKFQRPIQIPILLGQAIANIIHGLEIVRLLFKQLFHHGKSLFLVPGFVKQGTKQKGQIRIRGPFFLGLPCSGKGFRSLLFPGQQPDFKIAKFRIFRIALLALPGRFKPVRAFAGFSQKLDFQKLGPRGCLAVRGNFIKP